MPNAASPIIAIVGNVKTNENAPAAAEALGRELAKAGFRILVYTSNFGFLEGPVVRGYVASKLAARRAIQVRYPLHSDKPSFPEQQSSPDVFDWRPDRSPDWEISFYQSLSEVDGILFMGGGDSTLVAGLVAMGHRMAILALAGFGGTTCKIWDSIVPGRDLPTAEDVSLMARPNWHDSEAEDCARSLKNQMARNAAAEKQRRLDAMRNQTRITLHGIFAFMMFLMAVGSVVSAWSWRLGHVSAVWLLFLSPLLAGIAGATVRLIFDLRQGAAPVTMQSSVTTAALGLIAGGIAGLLFITAQVTTAPPTGIEGEIVSAAQASKLVPFGVLIGFVAGLTLDAVFRKLIASDVVDVSSIELKRRT